MLAATVIRPSILDGLTRWEVTIAELLSGAGYSTGHFGKWHLGSDDGRLPNDQGFDEWYGIPRSRPERPAHIRRPGRVDRGDIAPVE